MKNITYIILNAFLLLFVVSCSGRKQEQRDYERMMAIYDEVEQQLGTDTIKDDNALVLQSDIYSARFYAEEQQNKIERRRVAMRRTVIFGTVFGLLLLGFAFYALSQWRKTKRHNLILAQQITEAKDNKENNDETSDSQNITTIKLSDLSDAELYAYLRELIENEKLFLDPEFDRQTLIYRTGLSKDRIGAAFARGSEHERITTLVRELRLDYAIHLMDEKSDLTIEQICLASGFTNPDTFTRNFKSKFGMTPTDYRDKASKGTNI